MTESKIKQLREQKKYTQDYVAGCLGLSQNAYCRLENGQTKLSVEKAEKLASIFDVPIWEVITTATETHNFQVSHSQNEKVAYILNEYQKETFDTTIQILSDEIAALREERKQFLTLIERLTLNRL